MFKVYKYNGNYKVEILPNNNLYTVYELGEYEFIYEGKINFSNKNLIFLEDISLEPKYFKYNNNQVIATRNRYFQDYFGYASLKINDEVFNFNILIEKLKLSEIEEILLFLWQKDRQIFNIFFSKSTLKTKIDKEGSEFGLSSKYLVFVNHFYDTFKKLYFHFENVPHFKLEKNFKEVNYTPHAASSSSIDWIFKNLDNIKIDLRFQSYPEAILLENNYGYLDKIQSEYTVPSYKTYENEIILGAFQTIINNLKYLKKEILSNVNLEINSNSQYADFRDLKKIPFIKLFDDSNSLQNKIERLFSRYKTIFPEVKPRKEKPKLTSVFSNRLHYLTAYKIILNSRGLKFKLGEELNLLNIRKLSQLYEAYNLHIIIKHLSDNLNLDFFEVTTGTTRDDNLVNSVSFSNPKLTINLYYELSYPINNNTTKLIRIDSTQGSYYKPDYVIEIIKDNNYKYYILDSKYTKYKTLKDSYLNDTIFKYILNTGIENDHFKKISYLVLIYPGDIDEDYIQNAFYNPQIKIISSKPKVEIGLSEFIREILEKELPLMLYKKEII